MPAKEHAVLAASSANRWLHCPPSVKLCEGSGREELVSEYAVEGTEAHALGEFKLLKALGRKAMNPTKKLKFYNEEMENCTDGYRDFVMETVEQAKLSSPDPIILVEQRVDFSSWVPKGFGTADALVIADGTLSICDYKHGQGIMVDATDNPQLKCYALGALAMFDVLYDIAKVRLAIYQPRRENVSVFEMDKSVLYEWANAVLKPTAALAFVGKGDFHCGEWCRFCKAKCICRARAEANLLLAQHDFRLPSTLVEAEIGVILSKVDELSVWANDVKDYALQQAISGKEWKGWKLVEGRSTRRYTSDSVVTQVVTEAGFDPYEKKLLGITAMQKLLGKQRFEELLKAYIEKPPGKPSLVPDSDKRPAINNAKFDFMEEKNHE